MLNLANKILAKELILDLWEAEFSREFDVSIRLFAPLWNIQKVPDFSAYSIADAAEFYHLAGKFLMTYGKSKNIVDWQERGKDALDKAAENFSAIDKTDRVFECRMNVAITHLYEGKIEEYQILLKDAESYFINERSHRVYLQIQINYALYETHYGSVKKARRLLESISDQVTNSNDIKIQVLFNNQAGISFRGKDSIEKSIEYSTAALVFARLMKNLYYEAMIINCIANTYRLNGRYIDALATIDKALELSLRNYGWYAHFLDTKANIYLDQGDYYTALNCIEESLKIFLDGDDVAGLAAAYWTQIQILLKLELKNDASIAFARLYNLAELHLGAKIANKYNEKYNAKIIIKPEGTFEEKVAIYKRSLIEDALITCKGKIVEASVALGMPKHATLSIMLRKNFPDLRKTIKESFGIDRQERSDKKK